MINHKFYDAVYRDVLAHVPPSCLFVVVLPNYLENFDGAASIWGPQKGLNEPC